MCEILQKKKATRGHLSAAPVHLFRGSLTFQPQTLNLSIFSNADMRYESGAQAAAKKAEIQEAAAAAKKARIVCFE